MLGKARDAERNNAIVNRMADLWECYTVGTGLRIQPASSDPKWNLRAAAWWDEWEPYADVASLQGWGMLQSLISRVWFIDGESFLVKVRGESGRPRLQMVESHLVATPDQYKERRDIIDGIQVDSAGRPVAYFIGTESDAGKLTFGSPTPASDVIHVFEPARPGQKRGITFLHPILNDLADLNDLQALEMQACKTAAAIGLKSITATGEPDVAQFRRSRFTRSNQDSAGTAVTESSVELVGDITGARVVGLKPGEDIAQLAAQRPADVTRNFWRLLETKICLGCGFPYVLVNPDSMQGTVYRGSLDMATAFFKARSLVISTACREVFKYVMGFAKNDPALGPAPADWWRCTIVPPRAPNVDVGHNSAAMLAELEVGATDYELIYAPQGHDWRKRFEALAEQRAYAKSLGLSLTPPAAQVVEPDIKSKEDDED